MAEYIDREAVRLAYEKSLEANRHNINVARAIHAQEHRHMLHVLDKIPAADVVAVGRCKDCEQWMRNRGIVDSPNGHCFYHDIETNGHDFCSYGKRRDNDATD